MDKDKNFTILVVDDSKSNLVVLYNILEPMYNVISAEDGPSGIEAVKREKPDLVLLDIVMPGMSGFDVLRELKNNEATMNIPVIFITGLDNTESEEMCLKLGAVDYITKPFSNSIVKLRVKTQLKIIEQIRSIERIGLIDALTNVPNRRSFDARLNVEWNRALRNKTTVGLMMLDIDDFKVINDTYGHAHGDEVLKATANIISETLKRSCDFIARWGGEEFAVILTEIELESMLKIAERIRQNVEETLIPCDTNGEETKITISIGAYSVIPEVGTTIEEFCSNADIALYEAKRTGKNKVVCYNYL